MGRGEIAPFRTRQFLEIAEDSDGSMTLICKLTNQGFVLLHLALTPQKAILFCLTYSRARYQATRDYP